jgi:hypothetical protein
MKLDENPRTVMKADMLVPRIGEAIGRLFPQNGLDIVEE